MHIKIEIICHMIFETTLNRVHLNKLIVDMYKLKIKLMIVIFVSKHFYETITSYFIIVIASCAIKTGIARNHNSVSKKVKILKISMV